LEQLEISLDDPGIIFMPYFKKRHPSFYEILISTHTYALSLGEAKSFPVPAAKCMTSSGFHSYSHFVV